MIAALELKGGGFDSRGMDGVEKELQGEYTSGVGKRHKNDKIIIYFLIYKMMKLKSHLIFLTLTNYRNSQEKRVGDFFCKRMDRK
jgi:hypothetical protein